MKSRINLFGVSTFALGLAWASCASAQTGASQVPDAPDQQASTGLEEIVVTAQRRSENLQRVPVAVSAVTADKLTASGISGIASLQVAVPSMSLQNSGGYMTLHLRGIGSMGVGPGAENPVALYIDGVYLANQSVGLVQFNNIDRIEVLKGPQGTLFGRNATGGLVQIITRDPSKGALFNGSVSYGNFDAVEAQAYAGGPLSDTVAADLGVRFSRHDPYGQNITTGLGVYKSKHDIALRSKIVVNLNDVKFTLIGDYNDRDENSNALTVARGTQIVPGVPQTPVPNTRDVNSNVQPVLRQKGGGVSLKAEGELGGLTISNLAAYREAKMQNDFDYDGSFLDIASVNSIQRDSQFSDEIQISSPSGGRFTWVVGAFYFRATSKAAPFVVGFPDDSLTNPAFPLITNIVTGKTETEALSGYAQGTFALTDQVNITGGARYSWEKRSIDARADGIFSGSSTPAPLGPPVIDSTSYSEPTFRAAIDYRPVQNVMLYASFNTGFKSGGYNVLNPFAPSYRPEKLTAYEIGEKADLFDRRLRINSAFFYYKYRDQQVQISRGTSTDIINGASSHVYGLDLEAVMLPVESLQINAGVTWLHSEFDSFPAAPVGTPDGSAPVVNLDVSGNRLPFAPKLATTLGATYTAEIGNDQLVANATWLHSSKYYYLSDNVTSQKAYDQVNANITYNFDGGRYHIGAFVNNLTNTDVVSAQITLPHGAHLDLFQPPRTYGVRVGFRY